MLRLLRDGKSWDGLDGALEHSEWRLAIVEQRSNAGEAVVVRGRSVRGGFREGAVLPCLERLFVNKPRGRLGKEVQHHLYLRRDIGCPVALKRGDALFRELRVPRPFAKLARWASGGFLDGLADNVFVFRPGRNQGVGQRAIGAKAILRVNAAHVASHARGVFEVACAYGTCALFDGGAFP